MVCLHCGLCCIQFGVVIVNPKYATEGLIKFDPVENIWRTDKLPKDAFIHKKGFNPCPHLFWEGDESRCKIHHYDWFKSTPCWDFTQVESKLSDFCRLGVYSIKEDGHEHWRLYTERARDEILSPKEITETFSCSIRKEIRNVKPEHLFQPDKLRQMSGRTRRG